MIGTQRRVYWTIEQVAEFSGVSVRAIKDKIKNKELRAYKPGKRLMFDPDDVEKWIKRSCVA